MWPCWLHLHELRQEKEHERILRDYVTKASEFTTSSALSPYSYGTLNFFLCFQILLWVCSTLSTICVFQFINLSYRVLILYNCFSRIRKCRLIMRLFSFSHSSNQQHSLNFEDNADGRMLTMWSLGSPSTLNSEVQLFLSFCPSFISRRGKSLYGLENTNTHRNGDSQSR